MVRHDFKCQSCSHVNEEAHSIHGAPQQSTCPECGGVTDRQLAGGVPAVTPDWKAYASIRLPKNFAGAKKHDSAGRPIFETRKQEAYALEKFNYVRE